MIAPQPVRRKAAERTPRPRFVGTVTYDARARKLQTQSDNCLAIAVRERDGGAAALLIDEALKLASRARQLSQPD